MLLAASLGCGRETSACPCATATPGPCTAYNVSTAYSSGHRISPSGGVSRVEFGESEVGLPWRSFSFCVEKEARASADEVRNIESQRSLSRVQDAATRDAGVQSGGGKGRSELSSPGEKSTSTGYPTGSIRPNRQFSFGHHGKRDSHSRIAHRSRSTLGCCGACVSASRARQPDGIPASSKAVAKFVCICSGKPCRRPAQDASNASMR